MAHTLEWSSGAGHALRRLSPEIRDRIIKAAEALQTDPRPRGAQKLRGQFSHLYRIRIGIHYRVAYLVDDQNKVVRVVKVGSREDVY